MARLRITGRGPGVAVLCAALAAAIVLPASAEVRIEIGVEDWGLGGVVKSGLWAPLYIQLEANQDFDGLLEVEVNARQKVVPRFVKPIQLVRNTPTRHWVYFRAPVTVFRSLQGHRYSWRLRERHGRGKVVAENPRWQRPNVLPARDSVVAVLRGRDVNKAGLGDLMDTKSETRVNVLFVSPSMSPDRVIGYEAADVVVRMNPEPSRLTPAQSDAIAHGLARAGLARGDRTCLFVRPGAEWVAIVYALFKLGAVPVLIDPGMGRRNVLASVERVRPRGFVGIPVAHVLRLASPRSFASVEVAVTVGRPRLWSGSTLEVLTRTTTEPFEPSATAPDERAAILFTSGSTGPPKGVAYTHGMFSAQVGALRELYGMRPGDVDLACFPLFALFGAALELVSVLPRMDFSRPATCDPERIVAALGEHACVQTFGSPAIWRRVIPWCRARGERLPDLKRLLIAGAPVPPRLIAESLEVLPADGDVHTPYGATEALPVASIAGRTILERFRERTERGEGNCVGRPASGVEIRLIELTDRPLACWDDASEVPPGELGEICVRGPVVTREYVGEPGATARAKIAHGDSIWHRMGDVGRLDGEGWLWFQGRLSHRLETEKGLVMPVGIENVFNLHERVRRSALVGVGARGSERPVLVVEPEPGTPRGKRVRAVLSTDILRAGLWFPPCAIVERVLYRAALPVDVRHNAKIKRGTLKRWAERELARRGAWQSLRRRPRRRTPQCLDPGG